MTGHLTILMPIPGPSSLQELRPLLAENAEALLQEAAEAIPFAPGYRGTRRKKRQRERLRVVRVSRSLDGWYMRVCWRAGAPF